MLYRAITWWPGAFHVFNGEKRIGIVSHRVVRINGYVDRIIWMAHNANFFTIKGEFTTRTDAAEAIPKGAIHQSVDAFS